MLEGNDAQMIGDISRRIATLNGRGYETEEIRGALANVSLQFELREHERLRTESGAPPRTGRVRSRDGSDVDGSEHVDRAKRAGEEVRKQDGREYSSSDTRSKRAKLLNEALNAVVDARHDVYGDPFHDFCRVAEILSTLGFRRYKNTALQLRQLRAGDIPIIQIAVKLSRLSHSPEHYDSILDIAGYAACAAECRNLG